MDYIAPPENLPKLLVNFINSFSTLRQSGAVGQMPANALDRIFTLIRSRNGEDLSMFKVSLLQKRIQRQMALHGLSTVHEYLDFIQAHLSEIDGLAAEIPAMPARFFRNPEAWEAFRTKALPRVLESKSDGSVLRIWVSGCAGGEEAYTMAIVVQEALEAAKKDQTLAYQIFATDIDKESVARAREGKYIANIESDVSPERLERFFAKEDEHYRLRPEIRERMVFAHHNIFTHPPFTHLDVMDCRSLLLYVNEESQEKLVPLFYHALNPGGILFLGERESIEDPTTCFEMIDPQWKILQRRLIGTDKEPFLELPKGFSAPVVAEIPAPRPIQEPSVATLAQDWLLAQYAPPSVIINENGDILYFHGRTGGYLEPHPGKASLNVTTMAREGLRYPITFAIRTATKEHRTIVREPVTVQKNGESQIIRLVVRPIQRGRGMEDLLMVSFEDVHLAVGTPPAASGDHGSEDTAAAGEHQAEGPQYADMEQELRDARSQLQHTVEDMQASQEELKSMNEELQSMNEELKSANEELTTSKEELQSTNEELLTVNTELQSKISELSRSNDDMQNVMRSTDVALLFLDNGLKVRRFTDPVTKIVSLRSSDVGRPITDLSVSLVDEPFIRDARIVLETLQVLEKQVRTFDGDWYVMRILPYRTQENRIDGVVVTFANITPIKKLELSLDDARRYAENIIASLREPIVVLDPNLKVISANRAFYDLFKVSPADTEGQAIYALGNRQWDIPQLRVLLGEILPRKTEVEGYEVEHEFPAIGRRRMRLYARKIQSASGPELIILTFEDLTEESAAAVGRSS